MAVLCGYSVSISIRTMTVSFLSNTLTTLQYILSQPAHVSQVSVVESMA